MESRSHLGVDGERKLFAIEAVRERLHVKLILAVGHAYHRDMLAIVELRIARSATFTDAFLKSELTVTLSGDDAVKSLVLFDVLNLLIYTAKFYLGIIFLSHSRITDFN